MSAAPEIKYTDRDVRENRDLLEDVYAYLRRYQGEFQFLVDAKMALTRDGSLPVPVARGVLNCMRVDPRVAGTLPPPLPPKEGGTVTAISSRRRKKYRGVKPCPSAEGNTVEHGYHGWEDEENNYSCEGWHLINRQQYDLPVRIKPEVLYVAAPGGKLIHTIMPVSEKYPVVAWAHWPASSHRWGFFGWNDDTYRIQMPVKITVKSACKYPSFVDGSRYLLTEAQAVQLMGDMENVRHICPHCAKELTKA